MKLKKMANEEILKNIFLEIHGISEKIDHIETDIVYIYELLHDILEDDDINVYNPN